MIFKVPSNPSHFMILLFDNSYLRDMLKGNMLSFRVLLPTVSKRESEKLQQAKTVLLSNAFFFYSGMNKNEMFGTGGHLHQWADPGCILNIEMR